MRTGNQPDAENGLGLLRVHPQLVPFRLLRMVMIIRCLDGHGPKKMVSAGRHNKNHDCMNGTNLLNERAEASLGSQMHIEMDGMDGIDSIDGMGSMWWMGWMGSTERP